MTNPDCLESPYPFNFSALREGCRDPVLGKEIKWLIAVDDDYIVYVDQNDYVEWTMNDDAMLTGCGALLTRVGALESADCNDLTPMQLETFKRLIGESIARMFERDLESAAGALDTAESWISARSQESSRVWGLQGATLTLLLLAVPFWSAFEMWNRNMTSGAGSVGAAAFMGSLGAWLSVLQRSGRAVVDFGAGRRIYWLDGMIRILTGAMGGFFVGMLLRSGQVFPQVQTNAMLFFAVCLVSGLSERLVNTLAGALEARIAPAPVVATPPRPLVVVPPVAAPVPVK